MKRGCGICVDSRVAHAQTSEHSTQSITQRSGATGSPGYWYHTHKPTISVQPGQTRRWRIVNAAPHRLFELKIDASIVFIGIMAAAVGFASIDPPAPMPPPISHPYVLRQANCLPPLTDSEFPARIPNS